MDAFRLIFLFPLSVSGIKVWPFGGSVVDGGGITRDLRDLQDASNFIDTGCVPVGLDCEPWPYGESAGDVEVPCETCYSMGSYVNGEAINLSGSLNIVGKLEIPDGTKLSLSTTGIIVQGELAITSTKVVNGDPDIIIKLTGSDDLTFEPHPINENACGGAGQSCNIGPKPLVAAGGRFNINGMNDDCPTWTVVEDVLTGAKPTPQEFATPIELPIPSEGECKDLLLSEDFENGNGKWYGNLGAQESILSGSHDGSDYLHISNREGSFQGPMLDISRLLRECMVPDMDYFLHTTIRLSSTNVGQVSECSNSGLNCPEIVASHMTSGDVVKWRSLAKTDSVTFQDGSWHEIKASFRFTPEQLDANNIFLMFAMNGPEAGINISMDNFSLSLPPPAAFPDPNDVCGNLIQNGSADSLSGFAAPMYPFIRSSTIVVKEENGNPYFSIANRRATHDTIAMELTTGCLEVGAVYTMSLKIKIDSIATVIPRVITKTHTGGNPIFDIIAFCPGSSETIGWITCTADYSFKIHHFTGQKVELLVFLKDDISSDLSLDDLSLQFKSGTPGDIALKEAENLDSCWGPGAEVVFPSETLYYDATTTTSLEATLPGGIIKPAVNVLPAPTTAIRNSFQAGEVALLSRNILFENGDDFGGGPSLTILNTPVVTQIIQGAEFIGFGTEAVAGSHPINFKSSGDATGSHVSKNSFRSSKHRCVNIDGTRNVLVHDNVAFDTYGHCYAIEGGAAGNEFRRNIGIKTSAAVSVANGASDDTVATFYSSYPTNSWIGNSAAGSENYGFWFQFNKGVDGVIDSWIAPLSAFEDNKSHSNLWMGIRTSPFGYNPAVPATLLNSRVYKNRGQGIFFHNTGNVIVNGGYFSDNRINIDILQDNHVTIKNLEIVGFSSEYRTISEQYKQTTPTFCNGNGYVGLRLHAREKEATLGLATINNVTFSHFDTDCSSAAYAIQMNPDTVRGDSYDTDVALSNLTFISIDAFQTKINFCDAEVAGITNIYVANDGSLNPSGSEKGIIISDSQDMIKGSCQTITGACALYCTGVNATDYGADEAMIKRVGDEVEIKQGANGLCLSNIDFEGGQTSWRAVNANNGLSLVTGFGGEGTALKIADRTNSATGGAWQDFLSSCLEAESWYTIHADVKMNVKGSDVIFDCNPTIMWHNDPMSCAGIGIFRSASSPPLKELAFTVGPYNASGWGKIYGAFEATQDIVSEPSLSLVVGRAAIAADITVDNVELQKVIGPGTIGVTNCSQPLQNGNAETGDHRMWWIFGINDPGTRIELSLGYGNVGYAFKHTGPRDKRNRGMLQKMDMACFPEGSNWRLTAQFKYFEEDGTPASCNKSYQYGSESCPVFQVLPGGKFGAENPPMLNLNETEMVIGEWNVIRHEFSIQGTDGENELHILLTSVEPGFNYELDNIELIPI